MISIFDLAAMLLTLSALFGWLNRRFLRMPHTIGLLVMGLLPRWPWSASTSPSRPSTSTRTSRRSSRQVDFTDVVMNGMLAFLLFAGAMSLDLRALRDRAWAVATLALVGTLISTAIVGGAFWFAADVIGRPIPLAWALVFGALISPTDPVAVLATLKNVKVPEALEVEMQGEALFNDGVGIVLFTVLVAFAAGSGGEATSAGGIARLLLQEAGGGLLLGVVTGYVAYRAMRAIDDFPVEVLITLALVAGTYALAQKLHASGPLAVVAAGLLVGDRAPRDAMSERDAGLRVRALDPDRRGAELGPVPAHRPGGSGAALRGERARSSPPAPCPSCSLARLVAVSTPLLAFRWGGHLSARNVPFLTWAGVRGGISVALALSIPESDAKPAILAATYAVVLFTIVVQGSTLGMVARRTLREG